MEAKFGIGDVVRIVGSYHSLGIIEAVQKWGRGYRYQISYSGGYQIVKADNLTLVCRAENREDRDV